MIVYSYEYRYIYSFAFFLEYVLLLLVDNLEEEQRRIQRGSVRGARPPIFCNHKLFYDHFKELRTVSITVIFNNAPLTCVYPNTIKTNLIPNHLLFGRQLLCYSNTISTVVRTLIVFSGTTHKINHISNHFLHRWRHDFVLNLCETQQASKLNTNSQEIMLYQFMMKRCPDMFGELPQ